MINQVATIRYAKAYFACNLTTNSLKKIELEKGEGGVSPGQACVFYKKDNFGVRVFGGGWIKKTKK